MKLLVRGLRKPLLALDFVPGKSNLPALWSFFHLLNSCCNGFVLLSFSKVKAGGLNIFVYLKVVTPVFFFASLIHLDIYAKSFNDPIAG